MILHFVDPTLFTEKLGVLNKGLNKWSKTHRKARNYVNGTYKYV